MRFGRLLVLSAILGVLTTTAVAWALAAWLPQRDWHRTDVHDPACFDRTVNPYGYSVWMSEFRETGAVRRAWSDYTPGLHAFWHPFDLAIESAAWDRGWPTPPPISSSLTGGAWGDAEAVIRFQRPLPLDGCEHATGWPMLAAWYSIDIATNTYLIKGGIPLRATGLVLGPDATVYKIRALPLRPIWLGIIVNTAFYALMWSGLLLSFATLRRWRRRRANRCPACAYDMTGLSATTLCPECGTR